MIRTLGTRLLGQANWLTTLISAGVQAGAATYGAYMQKNIAKMQDRTQKEIVARQEAAAKAQADADRKAAEAAIQAQGGAPGATPMILGIDRDVFIAGGVGLGLVLGVVAIVVSKKSSAAPAAAPAAVGKR